MDLLKKNLSPLRYCEGGPFEITVSGVPASNAQAVVNLLITSKKLFEYSGAANTFTALTPSASSTFRELAALAESRAEFESMLKPFEKKHHDDLCEAWAVKNPAIHDAFVKWVPLARKTIDLEDKLINDFTEKATPDVLATYSMALRAAKKRLDDEIAAANAVVLDPRAAKKAAKLAEKERLKKEAEEEETGGNKAKKAQKKAIKEAEMVSAAGAMEAVPLKIKSVKVPKHKGPAIFNEKGDGTPTPKAA